MRLINEVRLLIEDLRCILSDREMDTTRIYVVTTMTIDLTMISDDLHVCRDENYLFGVDHQLCDEELDVDVRLAAVQLAMQITHPRWHRLGTRALRGES